MRAAGPTTWPPHPLAHFIKTDHDTAASGFRLLGRRHPADPLIARKRRDIRPHILRDGVRLDRLSQIRWRFMNRAGLDNFFGHDR